MDSFASGINQSHMYSNSSVTINKHLIEVIRIFYYVPRNMECT